jgi:hypothetical protein
VTAVHHPTDFTCPGCGVDYKVVRVKAEADPPHRLIHCKVCKRSLAPTNKKYILKYFLISRKQGAKQTCCETKFTPEIWDCGGSPETRVAASAVGPFSRPKPLIVALNAALTDRKMKARSARLGWRSARF